MVTFVMAWKIICHLCSLISFCLHVSGFFVVVVVVNISKTSLESPGFMHDHLKLIVPEVIGEFVLCIPFQAISTSSERVLGLHM